MEKRLKLHPPSQQEKFDALLKPMTSLKSYVSVADFLRRLNTDVQTFNRTALEADKHSEEINQK